MINLIPKEDKKKMARNFYYRLSVVYLVSFSVVILIGILILLPSYVLVYMKEDSINKKLEAQKNEPVSLPEEQTLASIKDLNNKLSLIENAQKNQFIVSVKVLNAIILEKMTDIKINNISYENDILKGKKIEIQGAAPSREALLSFRQALEDSLSFKQVDLPISNFVKGSDIQFSLSLIPS